MPPIPTNLLPCDRPRRGPGEGLNSSSSPGRRGGVGCGPCRPSVPTISDARTANSAGGNSIVLETSDTKHRKARQGNGRVKRNKTRFHSTKLRTRFERPFRSTCCCQKNVYTSTCTHRYYFRFDGRHQSNSPASQAEPFCQKVCRTTRTTITSKR